MRCLKLLFTALAVLSLSFGVFADEHENYENKEAEAACKKFEHYPDQHKTCVKRWEEQH